MSNLSELLPAGAGAKSADFVASGTLGSGVTVALQSDGTVKAVGFSSSSIAENVGTETQFENAGSTYIRTAFDVESGKVVISYTDVGGSYYGTVVIGTVSGNTISFGTAVVYNSASANWNSLVYDSTNKKTIISYMLATNLTGYAKVGTVSGTSISFGSAVQFSATSDNPAYISSSFDTSAGKIVTAYTAGGAGSYAKAVVGTVSGTSISFGSVVVFRSANTQEFACVYDTNANKTVILYRESSVAGAGEAIVGTVSGTSISFGSAVQFDTSPVTVVVGAYDSLTNQVICAYTKVTTKVVLGTVSGTSISFGAIASAPVSNSSVSKGVCYDTNVNKIVVSYGYGDASPYANGTIATGTVSGTSVTFATQATFNPTTTSLHISAVYDSTNKKAVVPYQENAASGEALVFQAAGTASTSNSTDFIGITDQAIADTATGAVIVQGGVNSSNAGASIPQEYTPSSDVDFDASGPTLAISSVFDTNLNKVVVFYSDYGNSQYGTAAVGTISAGVISFGTPVVFNSADISSTAAAFDSSANKSVIAYRDGGASNQGKAIVGTVSGTSISFGAEATFNAASTTNIGSTFDSTANKVVIAFRDDGNSDYGTAIVGTVSGTSVSFGSETVFETTQTSYHSLAYDPDENKTVLNYRHDGGSGYGKSRVGTVSGTSISFGTAVTFNAASTSFVSSVYDTAQNKTVIAYANANAGTGIVGTVSGTSISFGTPAVFLATSTGNITTAFDSTANKVVVAYSESVTTFDGFSSVGTVSGTDISFAAGTKFSGETSYSDSDVTYDSTANKVVFSFRNGTPGTAVVGTLSGGAFTPNTNYYVQTDGSLSTTVSSVLAGKALSSTSINLDYTT